MSALRDSALADDPVEIRARLSAFTDSLQSLLRALDSGSPRPGPLTPPGPSAASVTELACAREKELRSAASEESLELDFQNATDRPLTLEWLDFNGGRVRYAAVEPGESYRQQTYVTHPWLAVDAEGKCLRVFVPRAAGLYTVRILGPDQRATTRWK